MTERFLRDVDALRARMQAVHDSADNLSLDWRLTQLQKIRDLLLEFWDEFLDALHTDLGKNKVEAAASDCILAKDEVDNAIRNVRQWMKAEKVGAPMAMIPSFNRIEKRPLLGPACLVIGPSNYPLNLCLIPLIGALSAGNPVVLKPSELTPKISALLERAIHKYFDAGVVRVLNGGASVTSQLIQLPWGKIFFTGSERVGKIVASAAAQTLTPVVLELGGQCPVFVDETAPSDMQVVANRIAWGKLFNTGQTCVAPDYVLVHESKLDTLLEFLVRTIEWQYGKNPQQSELGRIVCKAHAERLQKMIEEVEQDKVTRVILGKSADCDPEDRYVCPTIILNPPNTAQLLCTEIFGPILPIISFKTRQEAINRVRSMPGTPLAMYVFTRQEKVLHEYMRSIRSGAVVRNDVSANEAIFRTNRFLREAYSCHAFCLHVVHGSCSQHQNAFWRFGILWYG